MRDRIADRCPRCGAKMRVVDGRERTLRDGIWYVIRCDNCLFTMDEWKPKRRYR